MQPPAVEYTGAKAILTDIDYDSNISREYKKSLIKQGVIIVQWIYM